MNARHVNLAMLELHRLRHPVRGRAVKWCRICGARHGGPCELVRVPARARHTGRPLQMPTFRRPALANRRTKRRAEVKHYGD